MQKLKKKSSVGNKMISKIPFSLKWLSVGFPFFYILLEKLCVNVLLKFMFTYWIVV